MLKIAPKGIFVGLLSMLGVLATPASQAESLTITRAEFIGQLERSFKLAAEQPPREDNEATYEILDDTISAAELEAIKKEDESLKAERVRAVADCINMPVNEFNALMDSINPNKVGQVSLEALDLCKSRVPPSIVVDPLNVNYDTLPELSRFNECFVQAQSDLLGVDLAEMQRCENQVADGDDF